MYQYQRRSPKKNGVIKVNRKYNLPTRKELAEMPIRDMLRHKAVRDPEILDDPNEVCLFVWRTMGAKSLKDVSGNVSVATILTAAANVRRELVYPEDESEVEED